MHNQTSLLSIGKVASILAVSIDTLRNWDKEGKLVSKRLPSGQRRYTREDVEGMQLILQSNRSISKSKRIYTTKVTPVIDDIPKPLPPQIVIPQELTPTYHIPGFSHSALTLLFIGASLLLASSLSGFIFKDKLKTSTVDITKEQKKLETGQESVLGITSDYLNSLEQRLAYVEMFGQYPVEHTRLSLTAKNIIKNPSFEAANGTVPRQWTYTLSSTQDTTVQSPEGIHSGYRGLKFIGATENGTGKYLGISQPQTETVPDRIYTFSLYLKHINLNSKAIVRIGFWDKYNNKYASIKTYEIYGTRDWERISFSTKTDGIITNYANWYPIIEVQNLKDGAVYIDDVQVEEGSIRTEFASNGSYFGSVIGGDGSILGAPNGDLYPATNGYGSLGRTDNRWEALYLTNATIDRDGNITAKSITLETPLAEIDYENFTVNNLTANGNVELGSDTTDLISFNGLLNTDIIPVTGSTYNLGSAANPFSSIYADNIVVTSTDIAGTTSNTFTLDTDNTGGNVGLVFGQANNEQLYWNSALSKFQLSDDLAIDNTLSVNGHASIGVGASIDTSRVLNVDETFTNTSGNLTSGFNYIKANPASNSSGSYRGVVGLADAFVNDTSNASNITGYVAGGRFIAQHFGTGMIGNMYGTQSIASNMSTGTVTNLYGSYSELFNNAAGPMTSASSYYSRGIASNRGPITNLHGLFVGSSTNGAGGSITNNYGVYISNQTAGTNNYALYSAGGRSYFAGNVGIGNTNPSARLNITGSGSDFSTYAMTVQNASGTTALTVNDNGNVGIGFTGVPDYSLVVGGTGRFVGSLLVDAANGSQIQATNNFNFLEMSHDGTVGYIGTDYGGPGGNTPLSFRITNTEAMRIDTDGDLGIGTTNPTAKLHISKAAGTTDFLRLSGSLGDVAFGVDTGDLRIVPAGNDVNVTGNISSSGGNEIRSYSSDTLKWIKIGDNGTVGYIGTDYGGPPGDHPLAFRITNTERMRLDADGDLGIGTTNPQADLDIASGASYSRANAGDTQFTASSSRTLKENFSEVSVANIRERILGTQVYTYDFIDGPKDKMGLIAEDFHAIFGRGSDKMINGQEVQMALWLGVQDLYNKVDSEPVSQLEQALSNKTAEFTTFTNRLASTESTQASNSATLASVESRLKLLEERLRTGEVLGIATEAASVAAQIDSNAQVFAEDVVLQKDLNVLGKVTADDLGITGSITAGLLSITGDENSSSISTLSGPLKLQELALGSLEIMAGKVIVDEKGTITLKEGDLEIEKGVIVGNDKIRGIEVEVEEGKNSITISFPEKRKASKYAVAVSTSWETGNAVKSKTDNGFTVTFTNTAPADATFDWIVID